MSSLDGRVVLVTGAAGGIGAAVVEALVDAGARVAATDVDEDRARAVAHDIASRRDGARVVAVGMDISDRASVDAALTTVDADLGPIDVLVNNAGIDRVGPFLASDEGTWDLLWRVNLRGPIACAHAVLPGMIERGAGRIVNIASDAGRAGSSGEVVYSATKGGVIAFTKALAREVARHGITVNCVCPGPTDTPLLQQVADASQGLRDALVRAIPLRRIAEPSDIAPVVVFLACDAAGYLTGQTVSVSGGLTMM